MKKYKKKPVIIEAIQLNRTIKSVREAILFIGGECPENEVYDGYAANLVRGGGLMIHTLEGDMLASWNDFIIKGIAGEFYPCKPDVFFKTYELIEDE